MPLPFTRNAVSLILAVFAALVLIPTPSASAQAGACCQQSISFCLPRTEANCDLVNGRWFGPGSTCACHPCGTTVPSGVCCRGSACSFEPTACCTDGTFLGSLATCASAPCPPACDPYISNHFGGETTAVAMFNATRLLTSRGTWLELLNLTDPNAPAPLSPLLQVGMSAPALKISLTAGASRAFVLLANGDVLAVAIASDGLGAPQIVSSSPENVDILADGNLVFIAHTVEQGSVFSSSIRVYDCSTGSPVLRASISPLTGSYLFDRLAKVGNVLWAAFHETDSTIYGIDGFDVANPAAPARTGSALANIPFGADAKISAMTAIDSRLLVSYNQDGGEDWMRAADVTNPSAPVWRTPVDLNGRADCMSSVGNHLRIAIRNSGVGTWDTTNPNALSWLGAYFDSYQQVSQMVAGASTDYWAAGRAGLKTMNFTNPASPSVRATLETFPIGPSQVRQRGNTTAVLDHTLNTLRLYDYTLPEAQQQRSTYFLPLYSELLEIGYLGGTGQVLACVATNEPGTTDRIALIDITNPAAPFLHFTIPNVEAKFMSVTNSRLYVFTYGRELRVYELSGTPALRNVPFAFGGSQSDYTCMTSWEAVTVKGVALGTELFGVWIINTTDATNPQTSDIHNPEANYRVRAVTRGANYLYVSAAIQPSFNVINDTLLESLNVNNPSNVTRQFVSRSNAGAGSLGVYNNLAYVSSPAGKFLIGTQSFSTAAQSEVDIHEVPPGSPNSEAIPFPIHTQDLAYVGGSGNIASNGDGSRILLCGQGAGLYQMAIPTQWAPGFGIEPRSPAVCYGGQATLTSRASGNPATLAYQWFRSGNPALPMADGPSGWGSTVSGATTPILSISSLHPRDKDFYYYCVATNSCGSATSATVFLSFCDADFNCSGGTATVTDIFAFLSAWFAASPSADFDGNGTVNVADIFNFLAAWFAPCF